MRDLPRYRSARSETQPARWKNPEPACAPGATQAVTAPAAPRAPEGVPPAPMVRESNPARMRACMVAPAAPAGCCRSCADHCDHRGGLPRGPGQPNAAASPGAGLWIHPVCCRRPRAAAASRRLKTHAACRATARGEAAAPSRNATRHRARARRSISRCMLHGGWSRLAALQRCVVRGADAAAALLYVSVTGRLSGLSSVRFEMYGNT